MKEVSVKEWLEFVLAFDGVYNTEPNVVTLAQNASGYGVVAKVTYWQEGDNTYHIDEVKHPLYSPDKTNAAPYVWLGNTAMRLDGDEYQRPAGAWSVKWVWKDGNQVAVSTRHQTRHLEGVVLHPCTKEEYQKDNEGHL